VRSAREEIGRPFSSPRVCRRRRKLPRSGPRW